MLHRVGGVFPAGARTGEIIAEWQSARELMPDMRQRRAFAVGSRLPIIDLAVGTAKRDPHAIMPNPG